MRPESTNVSLAHCAIIGALLLASSSAYAQFGGQPGAFSRMGFGARGMGMGNAMTAVLQGELVGYYNPALLPFTQQRFGAASFGFLSLDRSLNFINYTQALPPSAGISAGIINAGVSDIDGRDSDGRPTGPLKTSENQVFLSFAARLKPGFSIGISLKLFHYHLYTDLNSTTVGIDLGVLFPLTDDIVLGATARDVNSRYSWDTGKLFGQQGQKSDDAFPRLYTIGASYRLLDSLALVAAELEFSNKSTAMARFGVEVPILPEFTLRGGIDRIDLKEKGTGAKPSLGMTVRTSLARWSPALTYAYVFEPFSPTGIHMITVSAAF
jgi:hypothetical protein